MLNVWSKAVLTGATVAIVLLLLSAFTPSQVFADVGGMWSQLNASQCYNNWKAKLDQEWTKCSGKFTGSPREICESLRDHVACHIKPVCDICTADEAQKLQTQLKGIYGVLFAQYAANCAALGVKVVPDEDYCKLASTVSPSPSQSLSPSPFPSPSKSLSSLPFPLWIIIVVGGVMLLGGGAGAGVCCFLKRKKRGSASGRQPSRNRSKAKSTTSGTSLRLGSQTSSTTAK